MNNLNQITQADWIEAIVKAWKDDKRIYQLLAMASHNEIACRLRLMTEHDFSELHECAKKLYPPLNQNLNSTQYVRVWLALSCRRASDAIFDGKDDLARKIMKQKNGGVRMKLKGDFCRKLRGEGIKKTNLRQHIPIAKMLNSEPSNWKKCK